MFTFRKGKRVASTIILIIGFGSPVFSQKTFLSLAAFNDSADHYLPRLLEKKALVSSASSYITETRNQFLPFIRFNDQVNIGIG